MDRHSGYIVVLDRDIREDDAQESILVALRMLKGVISVQPIVSDPHAAVAEMRIRHQLRGAIMETLNRET